MKRFITNGVISIFALMVALLMPRNAFAQTEPEWTGTAISAGMASTSAPCYLYNVGTGAFLINGGLWGTGASLNADYGLPIIGITGGTNNVYKIQTSLSTGQGQYLCSVYTYNATYSSPEDMGIYCDRGVNGSSGFTTDATTEMTFVALNDGNNGYNIKYTNPNSGNASVRGTFYLTSRGVGEQVVGTANAEGDNSKWIVVTNATVFEKLGRKPADLTNPTNVTFRLNDANFDRGSTLESSWKLNGFASQNANTRYYRLGTDSVYKIAVGGSYTKLYSGNKAQNDYERPNGKYFGVEVKNPATARLTNGQFYQDVTLQHGGWYRVSCQGFYHDPTNPGVNNVASLFATADGRTASNYLTIATTEGHALPESWNAAQRIMFDKATSPYRNSVMIHVEANSTLRLGISWVGAKANDWTVFDDFQLEFLGEAEELVLFEDNLNHEYLQNTVQEYKNVTMLFNRTFTENKWNTLVLPVSLTKEQFDGAFGANARAAQLKWVRGGTMHFETIKKTALQKNDVMLEANVPYLVFIQNNPTNTAQRTIGLEKVAGKNVANTENVSVSGDLVQVTIGSATQKYYQVPFVTLANKSDLVYNPTTWGWDAVDKNKVYDDDNNNHWVIFSGVYEKTYTQPTGDLSREIRAGYPSMVGRVILKDGGFHWIDENYGMKAYRAFLDVRSYLTNPPVEGGIGGELDVKIGFDIDGIEDEETFIADLTISGAVNTNNVRAGVYTVNGQMINTTGSTAGLAKGVYVINGKTCVVK